MRKREIIILSSLLFLIGALVGFLASPIKKGVRIHIAGVTTTNHHRLRENESKDT
ncbi:hypothetical protein KGF86_11320 [Ornithinibacillus massiliensis]|uniref:Uncharacterized protein n=1 Tax=Ornithinibacillus massiliensis TaxID=1944633 RepID=A0ABS5MG09_9BACI|nr:hypothetical protein [Ornithinibacillus massiliensis]MBS3680807.1 hypothetical protein [Ornithinibacillus massiliensis]